MKNSILTAFGLLLAMQAPAQKITGHKIFERDDAVTVSFTVETPKLPTNEKLTITPVIYNGSQSKSLQPIIIVGRNKAISEQRIDQPAALRSTDNQQIEYEKTVPYESWMSDISLRIDRTVQECCSEEMLAPLAVVTDRAIRYDIPAPAKVETVEPELTPIEQLDAKAPYLHSIKDYAAITGNLDSLREDGALIIRFRQRETVIDTTFSDNREVLQRVKEVVRLVEADPLASVGKIVLIGAASPEGTAKKNDILSQKRAGAFKQEMGAKYDSLFNLINIGEDWTGLRRMVAASDMQYKHEVLYIIDTYPVEKGREKRLMDLKWGRPYNYMLEHFFPQLRSASYIRIFYNSEPSADFEKTNRAIAHYNDNQYGEALAALEGIAPTATTEEIRGVSQMIRGDYAAARAALDKARELGSERAATYLEQLAKLEAVKASKLNINR